MKNSKNRTAINKKSGTQQCNNPAEMFNKLCTFEKNIYTYYIDIVRFNRFSLLQK